MALATVNTKCEECGNEFVWKKTCRNRTEADKAEEWAKSGGIAICPECYKKMMIERSRSEKEKVLEQVKKECSLVQLAGSEKQVAWAETIRATAVKILTDYLESRAQTCNISEDNKDYIEFKNNIVSFANQFETAKEWIDKRFTMNDTRDVVALFAKYAKGNK